MAEEINADDAVIRELNKRIKKLEEKADKRQKKQAEKEAKAARKAAEEKEMGLYYTSSEPRKSFSTFMRNQNKLYVNAINVIDRKAAIMIRVNSTIVSAIVIFFQYIEGVQFGVYMGVVMIIFSFISLMLAINASRPHIFNMIKMYGRNVQSKYKKTEEGIFTLGANADLTLEEYERAFEKLVSSQSLQIGNQVRSMYLFEKQQRKSFFRIEASYIAFMTGFSITIVLFIIGALKNHLL